MRKNSAAVILFLSVTALFQPAYAVGKSELRAACKQDVQSYCNGIKPGGGRIAACMKEHASQLSADCKTAITASRAAKKASQ